MEFVINVEVFDGTHKIGTDLDLKKNVLTRLTTHCMPICLKFYLCKHKANNKNDNNNKQTNIKTNKKLKTKQKIQTLIRTRTLYKSILTIFS